jgi:hypothetical protein
MVDHPHKIPVGSGVALVDSCDAHLVRQYRWHPGGTKNHYAITAINGKNTYMHRLILDAGKGEIVDHIDGNPLNNRRSNLRLVTPSENSANRSETSNPWGFKGVCYYEQKHKFQARVCKEGATYRGPYRKTPEQAAQDYDALARGIYGPFATFNFPQPGERGVTAIGGGHD